MKQEFINRQQDKLFAASLLALSLAACDDPNKVSHYDSAFESTGAVRSDYNQRYNSKILCVRHGVACYDDAEMRKDASRIRS